MRYGGEGECESDMRENVAGIDLRKFFWSVFGRSHMINDSQSWVGRTNFRA